MGTILVIVSSPMAEYFFHPDFFLQTWIQPRGQTTSFHQSAFVFHPKSQKIGRAWVAIKDLPYKH